VDIFVAGVGTGGTITGTARYLKERNPQIRIVAVEPDGSPLLAKGRVGMHRIQGIGANFIPEVLDRQLLDGIFPVPDEAAMEAARSLAGQGLLCGISSGAAFYAAKTIAEADPHKIVVTLLPDAGSRYLSAGLYE
jgi:cysteine synthase A